MGAHAASGFPVMEIPSVSFHIQGNTQFLEPGFGTKDNRNFRKFSNARANP
jgi:hypothetical protein